MTDAEFSKQLGKKIKERRLYLKQRRKDINHLSDQYLVSVENGDYRITLIKFLKLCRELKTTPEEMLKGLHEDKLFL